MDQNRYTTIPIKTIPQIVEWLLNNCTPDEIEFMNSLSANRTNFELMNSIFTRLTDYKMHELFYEKNISNGEELMIFRAASRGEVAGLKAFSMACQSAHEKLKKK